MKKLASLLFLGCTAAIGADIRLGIIGTDTSHVIVFTQMFNDASRPDHVPGGRRTDSTFALGESTRS